MTLHIELKPEVQAGLAAQAKAKGVPLDAYVQNLLEQLAVPLQPLEIAMTAEQRVRALREWTASFPYRRSEPLSDDAISRDSLYGGE